MLCVILHGVMIYFRLFVCYLLLYVVYNFMLCDDLFQVV